MSTTTEDAVAELAETIDNTGATGFSRAVSTELADLLVRDAGYTRRTDVRDDVFAYLGITDDVFLPEGHKIKRVTEDRRRDLGAMVTTSMVTVADLRAAFADATGTENP
jgi:hypothetical protein